MNNLDKAIKVIESCETLEQLNSIDGYISLLLYAELSQVPFFTSLARY